MICLLLIAGLSKNYIFPFLLLLLCFCCTVGCNRSLFLFLNRKPTGKVHSNASCFHWTHEGLLVLTLLAKQGSCFTTVPKELFLPARQDKLGGKCHWRRTKLCCTTVRREMMYGNLTIHFLGVEIAVQSMEKKMNGKLPPLSACGVCSCCCTTTCSVLFCCPRTITARLRKGGQCFELHFRVLVRMPVAAAPGTTVC